MPGDDRSIQSFDTYVVGSVEGDPVDPVSEVGDWKTRQPMFVVHALFQKGYVEVFKNAALDIALDECKEQLKAANATVSLLRAQLLRQTSLEAKL